jgi:hypothetical protein
MYPGANPDIIKTMKMDLEDLMAAKFSDHDIDALIKETKKLPYDFKREFVLRDKRGHKEAETDILGINGSQFRLFIRQSQFNPFDFSIILAYLPSNTNLLFRLRRYNGKSHEHTNPIEKKTFYDSHIHFATERYQEFGTREDTFAEPTNRFSDIRSALDCMLEDCGFEVLKDPQRKLFKEFLLL